MFVNIMLLLCLHRQDAYCIANTPTLRRTEILEGAGHLRVCMRRASLAYVSTMALEPPLRLTIISSLPCCHVLPVRTALAYWSSTYRSHLRTTLPSPQPLAISSQYRTLAKLKPHSCSYLLTLLKRRKIHLPGRGLQRQGRASSNSSSSCRLKPSTCRYLRRSQRSAPRVVSCGPKSR